MEVEKITDLNEIYFPKLGWRFHIDPTAFKIGSFEIQWYGIIITVGLLLALIYCFPRMKRFGLDSDRAVDAVIGGVLGGIIGARLYYVLFNLDEYKKDSFGATMKEVFNIRGGGLAIYGGIIGALTVGLIICKLRKVKMLPMLDITVLGFLIGQGIGRWGNFTNQEAFGKNTSNFLGMTGGKIQDTIFYNTSFISDDSDKWSGIEPLQTVHPCFLYESLWCLLGFVLISWYSKRRRYDGQILLMYLSWYGAERFVVEGLRTDSLYIGNSDLRVSQVLSAVIFVTSVILQFVFFFRYRRDPEAFELYANTEESHRLIEESRRKRMGMSFEDARAALGDEDDDDFDDDFDDDDFNDDFDDDEEDGKPSAPSILGDDDDDDDATDEDEAAEDKAEELTEAVGEKAEELTETAENKAEEAAEAAEEKAEELTETAETKAEEAAEAVEEKLEEADENSADKYEELAEEVDEKLRGGSGKGSHNRKKRKR